MGPDRTRLKQLSGQLKKPIACLLLSIILLLCAVLAFGNSHKFFWSDSEPEDKKRSLGGHLKVFAMATRGTSLNSFRLVGWGLKVN